jgi:alpha-ketoglutarate-dependent taurine dioxygenase
MIGAEVFGIAAREEQPPEVIDAIRLALFTHHVLVLRDQSLTPEEQIRFARTLGHVAPPEPRPCSPTCHCCRPHSRGRPEPPRIPPGGKPELAQ